MRTCYTLDSFAAFSDTVVSPGAVKGQNILDSISGIIAGITPAASTAVTNAISGGRITPAQAAAINVAQAQQSNRTWLIVGGSAFAILVLVLLMKKKGKK